MKTALFDFDLPASCIASVPAMPRDSARMLVVKPQTNALQDSYIHHLPDCFSEGNIMVFNNTKVIPARLYATRGNAKLEITLHKAVAANIWHAFARPGKRLREGDRITIADDFSAIVRQKREGGEVELMFECPDPLPFICRYGHMPLPPYIKRADNAADKSHYQTVYASRDGAVAAPTAGLHFTDALLAALDDKGIKRTFVTLHVGAGTFMPVKSEDTSEHKMHSEYAEISEETARMLNAARQAGKRIIAVGTTSLRVLESATGEDGTVQPYAKDTDIFITPGYRFKAVDILLTNFHLPRSTLFMLVSAFCGLEGMQKAYAHAIHAGYRFYSYGDACLLYRG